MKESDDASKKDQDKPKRDEGQLTDYWALDRLINSLQERAKELNCLYQIEEILREPDQSLDEICPQIIEAIPPGWQYPDVCQAKIVIEGKTYTSPNFRETEWVQSANIAVQDMLFGTVSVYYTEQMPAEDDGPFLKEETRLIRTIGERIGHRVMHRRMRQVVQELDSAREEGVAGELKEWPVVLKMLRQTDKNLYLSISRKMLNHLCWSGVQEALRLAQAFGTDEDLIDEEKLAEWNKPHTRRDLGLPVDFSATVFRVAADNLIDDEITRLIQKWIQEDKLGFLSQVVNRNLSLAEVADAIRRFHHIAQGESTIYSPSRIGIHVSLIRRFLSDQLPYINIAKNYIEIDDFYNLLQNIIFSTESHGKLGGKSAGLYLATQILRKEARENEHLQNVKVPRTWYISSDVLLYFMHYNNFDEVVEQKYKDINQVRLEYPYIVQSFKSARFPPDIVKGLSVALDDTGDGPLIVRSSSLLEDRVGAAFSGKYKSLFLANQGSKQQRLEALMDAIAEVYASTFGPDPVEYRAERGLIDFGEEMGIMIQEVVGTRVGKYFMPSFAGVAFSKNEFRWSPRIGREDGLVRLVPGLGTRAVDRLSDDYSIMIAPGQPGLRVNVTTDEAVRYSPRKIDIINLETNTFETVNLNSFLKEVGYDFPGVRNIASVLELDHFKRLSTLDNDFESDELVATFEGLISDTSFIKQIRAIIQTLEKILGYPVDIEFASDGRNFYLLQCRSQSYSPESSPVPLPKDIPRERVIFTANKYVANGSADITHIVYVDPRKYSQLPDKQTMVSVGKAIGRLNMVLPKRQFILMGPGRWGSRGDIKLGVSVTYSEINNSAALVEIAFKQGNYLPDVSFGTHFFQDLVEAGIKYLPLYPDDGETIFNERFLTRSPNVLAELLPDYSDLVDTIYVIDVRQVTNGQVLRLLMNGELDEAMGILTEPVTVDQRTAVAAAGPKQPSAESYWIWRQQFAEHIASHLEPGQFGVVGMYIFGSTKNAAAGPGSDIDLLIHFRGSDRQLEELQLWLEGWSLCLSELNYLRTGYKSDGLLDVHIVTDKDIESKSSYAAKIGAITDPARPLIMGKEKSS